MHLSFLRFVDPQQSPELLLLSLHQEHRHCSVPLVLSHLLLVSLQPLEYRHY